MFGLQLLETKEAVRRAWWNSVDGGCLLVMVVPDGNNEFGAKVGLNEAGHRKFIGVVDTKITEDGKSNRLPGSACRQQAKRH